MDDIDIENFVVPKIERRILLLCDYWSSTRDGITAVNRSLALNLARYKDTSIYSTILGSTDSVNPNDINKQVELIPSVPGALKQLYHNLDSNPELVYPDLKNRAPKVSIIVGHAPITAQAAVYLRDKLYPHAKVILFYHVIPTDIDWLDEALPYPFPDPGSLVRLGEKADVVYSVTDRCHWYFTAKFRNRAKEAVDHRKFYPQCPECVFSIKRKQMTAQEASGCNSAKILVLCDGGDLEDWKGIDIAIVAVSKAVDVLISQQKAIPSLKIGGLSPKGVEAANKKLDEWEFNFKIEICSYDSPQDMHDDLENCTLCLIPCRSEPLGSVGLAALSAGIPTLISQESGTATAIARLTSEPEYFTVPVTPTALAYRQDGSVWRDRVLFVLEDLLTAQERAMQLRMALKRDEPTKQTFDDFVTNCLGGIQLLHNANRLAMLVSDDGEKELVTLREFNEFLTAVLKQCWRLKHHPLTKQHDLFQLIPGVRLPITELVSAVIDQIEDDDRQILSVDETTGAFKVYCPSTVALRNLWSNCDKINKKLIGTLLSGKQPGPLLKSFNLEYAQINTSIKGPEFLLYKEELLKTFKCM